MGRLVEEVLRLPDIVEVVSVATFLKKALTTGLLALHKAERGLRCRKPSCQIFKQPAVGGGNHIRFVMEMEGICSGKAVRK